MLVVALVTVFLLVGYVVIGVYTANTKTITDTTSLTTKPASVENHVVYFASVQDGEYRFIERIFLISFSNSRSEFTVSEIDSRFVIYNPILGGRYGLSITYNNAIQQGYNPFPVVNAGVANLLGIAINGYTFIDSSDVDYLRTNMALGDSYASVQDLFTGVGRVNLVATLINFRGVTSRVNSTYQVGELLTNLNMLLNYRYQGSQRLSNNFGYEEQYSFGTGLNPDLKLINEYIEGIIGENELLAEQIKVEIFNASDVSGLAGRYTRLLNNYGINVVRYNNAPKLRANTVLFVNDLTTASKNISTIISILPIEVEISNDEYEYNATGDVVLVLGQDNLLQE